MGPAEQEGNKFEIDFNIGFEWAPTYILPGSLIGLAPGGRVGAGADEVDLFNP